MPEAPYTLPVMMDKSFLTGFVAGAATGTILYSLWTRRKAEPSLPEASGIKEYEFTTDGKTLKVREDQIYDMIKNLTDQQYADMPAMGDDAKQKRFKKKIDKIEIKKTDE